MQFILSQQELDELRNDRDRKRQADAKALQAFCTKVADGLPILGWHTHGEGPKPWGCVLTAEADGQEWYCDDCPAQDFCPLTNKRWSK